MEENIWDAISKKSAIDKRAYKKKNKNLIIDQSYDSDKFKNAREKDGRYRVGFKRSRNTSECVSAVFYQYPKFKTYNIPREVVDNPNLGPNEWLTYGFVASFPRGVKLYRYQLAGMSHCSIDSSYVATKKLEEQGLLVVKHNKMPGFFGACHFKVLPVKSRFTGAEMPRFVRSDITNILDDMKEYFTDETYSEL